MSRTRRLHFRVKKALWECFDGGAFLLPPVLLTDGLSCFIGIILVHFQSVVYSKPLRHVATILKSACGAICSESPRGKTFRDFKSTVP